MAEVAFVGVPAPVVAAAIGNMSEWLVVGERMLERSKSLCPVSRTENQGGSDTNNTSGSLKASLEVRYEYGFDPRIMVGSTLTRGDDNVSALGLVEMGTDPHPIDPKQPGGVLRFTSGGTVVFAAHVDHPGTNRNQFVERAMREVILESVTV